MNVNLKQKKKSLIRKFMLTLRSLVYEFIIFNTFVKYLILFLLWRRRRKNKKSKSFCIRD